MDKVEISLDVANNPFACGFLNFFMTMYPSFKNGINKKILRISDKNEYDVSLVELDIEAHPYHNASVYFMNSSCRKTIYGNRYPLPFLSNTYLDPVTMPIRGRSKKQKIYKCVAMFRTFTNQTRINISNYLDGFCDVIIIDGHQIKIDREGLCGVNDYYNILDSSQFSICPPGATYDTCRYTESLYCNCIPLTMYAPDIIQMVQHPKEYTWDENSIKNFQLPKFDENILKHLQNNIDRGFLFNYICDKINKHVR
jgi:hypothetical protein